MSDEAESFFFMLRVFFPLTACVSGADSLQDTSVNLATHHLRAVAV